jgi:putative transposase
MSAARPVYKGVRLFVTRRVAHRVFRLRPSRRVNQIVRYVVAVVAARTNIRIHAIVVMSNHWHVCLSDPDGRICEFTRDCHAFIARAVNAGYGDFENLWSTAQTSHVECVEPDDLIRKIAYTMANPVEAGLVRYGRHWPGVRAAWPAAPRVVSRPAGFFRGEAEGGCWPDEVVFELSRPPGYEHLADDELVRLIAGAVNDREEHFRRVADRRGRRFLGRRAILNQLRHASPERHAPHFCLSPRVACRDKWRRIERLQQDQAWLAAYRQAWRAWTAGDRDAIFPYGTYQMRIMHRVRCTSPPA